MEHSILYKGFPPSFFPWLVKGSPTLYGHSSLGVLSQEWGPGGSRVSFQRDTLLSPHSEATLLWIIVCHLWDSLRSCVLICYSLYLDNRIITPNSFLFQPSRSRTPQLSLRQDLWGKEEKKFRIPRLQRLRKKTYHCVGLRLQNEGIRPTFTSHPPRPPNMCTPTKLKDDKWIFIC